MPAPEYEYPVKPGAFKLFLAFDYYDAQSNVYNEIAKAGVEGVPFANIIDNVLHNPMTVARAVTSLIDAGIVERVMCVVDTYTGTQHLRNRGRLRIRAHAVIN